MDRDRIRIGEEIARRLRDAAPGLRTAWQAAEPIPHFVVDDLLPEAEVIDLHRRFPDPRDLMLRATMRERKRVGVDIESYDPWIGEALLAFQHEDVVRAVEEITGLPELEPDPTLYASGISVMDEGDFLEPHLDNSHDGDGKRYRVLNLLWYVSPDRRMEDGGHLELWDPRVTERRTIGSDFNRLVVMETNRRSWHSVSRVASGHPRCCISNYYFSAHPPGGRPYRNVTSFAGRPEEPLKRLILRLDSLGRNLAGRLVGNQARPTRHRLRRP